mmetsp:Transcript_10766/g.28793  ORF Transcript_10766/g.28793 Transcript_10766/m.28793 type:complete len:228 (-) Transcript_10766:179-862(-)
MHLPSRSLRSQTSTSAKLPLCAMLPAPQTEKNLLARCQVSAEETAGPRRSPQLQSQCHQSRAPRARTRSGAERHCHPHSSPQPLTLCATEYPEKLPPRLLSKDDVLHPCRSLEFFAASFCLASLNLPLIVRFREDGASESTNSRSADFPLPTKTPRNSRNTAAFRSRYRALNGAKEAQIRGPRPRFSVDSRYTDASLLPGQVAALELRGKTVRAQQAVEVLSGAQQI